MTNRIDSSSFRLPENQGNLECITTILPEAFGEDAQILAPPMRDLYKSSESGADPGSKIVVKVISPDKKTLLHRRAYTVVSSALTNRAGINSSGHDIVATYRDYVFEPLGDWWSSSSAPIEAVPVPVEPDEVYVPGESTLEHTGGRNGSWKVMCNDEVWAVVERLADETKEEHRARAEGIAAGSFMKPLTEAA